MESALRYFHRIRHNNPGIDETLKDILSSHRTPQDGLTMSELRAEYKVRTGQAFPINKGPIGMTEFLLTIPYIAGYCNTNGTLFFYNAVWSEELIT